MAVSEASYIAHILIIVQNLSVPLDRRVWLECRALEAAGYRVSVISPKGEGDRAREILDGVAIYRYTPPPPAKGPLGYLLEFVYCWIRTAVLSLRIWRRSRFDVIQACNPPDTYWLLGLLWRGRSVKFIYDQHDLNPELFQSRFGQPTGANRLLLMGLLWLERMTYHAAHHVVATNESYKGIALTRGRRRPSDVTVVRSGPDTRQMRPVYPTHERVLPGEFRLAYLGIMGPQDNVDVLIDVMDELVLTRGRTHMHLTMLGFGDCLEDLKSETQRRGLSSHITFTGRVGPTEIAQYLSAAHVGVGPDRKTALNNVSTMNKTMEYMAFALPCVSFDLSESRVTSAGSAIYVTDGDLAAFADAIERLEANPQLRVQLGRSARARAESTLDWRPQAVKYVTMYDQVVGHDRLGPLPELAPPPSRIGAPDLVDLADEAAFTMFLRERGPSVAPDHP